MKVYVIFDPLFERCHSVYKNYDKSCEKCHELNTTERNGSIYTYEIHEFDLIED